MAQPGGGEEEEGGGGGELGEEGRVTLIITTSPTPSAPSTELVSTVLASFRRHAPALLACAAVVVVIDTYDSVAAAPRLKKGVVTPAVARDFAQYRRAVKDEVLAAFVGWGEAAALPLLEDGGQVEAEYGHGHDENNDKNSVTVARTQTADGRVVFLEPARRLGFALAVRTALRATATPYCWVNQHDWRLDADIPVSRLVDVMAASERGGGGGGGGGSENDDDDDDDDRDEKGVVPVRYICLASVRMLGYATSAHVELFPALGALTAELKRDFYPRGGNGTNKEGREGEESSLSSSSSSQSPSSSKPVHLTPMFFWHDKPHLCSVAHYLARVFPSRLSVSRGDFIEDTVGHRLRDRVKRGGRAEWERFGTWLYYPGGEGRVLCLRHLQGRTFRGAEGEREQGERWRRRNAAALGEA